ncbi:MAG: hypothetical protein LKJ17_11215 [Oscillospiraceae bacterium]|jgi:anaerobic ribonucleoside-triphosphate reductase|nr:hypothetical protein [Oscillospiraceae bacterium]
MQSNVTVVGGTLAQAEVENYIQYVNRQNPGRAIRSLQIEPDGEYVNLSYQLEPVSFERIRRITGYLVGTMDRWNNAKCAEERDRVKHGM